MGLALPKQYARLAGQPLIAHSLATLQAVEKIERVFVVLSPDDTHWDDLAAALSLPRVSVLRVGGETRAMSVSNGLDALVGIAAEDDWVLVHDAARACLLPEHVTRLIDAVGEHPIGGLLAVPIADTVKRADADGQVAATVPREGLWQAQTPQMFRFGLLRSALKQSAQVTDESSALEAAGHQPLLVEGDARNFKVTRAHDLLIAQRMLEHD